MPDRDRDDVWRAVARTGLLVAGVIAVYFVAPIGEDRWWPAALIGAGAVAATLPLAIRRLYAVLASEKPVVTAVEALMLLLVMLVIGFASLYVALDHENGQFSGLNTRLDSLYFTITTLSTVGFGDITATGQLARALVTLQIVFNLAFVGVAVRAFTAAARRGRPPENL